jgi:hypothetical protein
MVWQEKPLPLLFIREEYLAYCVTIRGGRFVTPRIIVLKLFLLEAARHSSSLLIPSLGTSTPFMSMLMRQRKRCG